MNHKENFEAVDQMLRIVRGEPGFPCGNLLVIAAGYFQKTPPVVVDGGKWATINVNHQVLKTMATVHQNQTCGHYTTSKR